MLSAHCAADRIRLQYSPKDIVTFGERTALKRAIASAEALHNFFSQIDAQIKQGKTPDVRASPGQSFRKF